MGDDCFPNLNPAHIHFRGIPGDITFAQFATIGKSNDTGKWINFGDDEPFVLLHFSGGIVEIIPNA